VEKFREVTPAGLITANTLNFKPIFECSFLKIVVGPPSPVGCASNLWSFASASKNLRGQRPLWAEIWSSEKVDLGGSESTSRTVLLVDQSSPEFFLPKAGGIAVDHTSF